MSKFVPATIACRCGHRFGVDVADSIHAPRVPERRAEILDGRFHVFPCPICGLDNAVEKLFVYLDFDAGHWLTVFPEPELRHRATYEQLATTSFRQTMRERAPELVKRWADRFTQRVVCGVAGLREKLVVFDAGLDDRMIELLKLDLIRSHRLVLAPGARLSLIERRPRSLLFHYAPSPGAPIDELEVPLAAYARMVTGFERYRDAVALMDGLFVDFRAVLGRDGAASAGARTLARPR